jgi:glycosyltransferase involved in cell wall biosynthesis
VAEILPHHPAVRLIIAGEGPERETLENLVACLEITEAVEFAGGLAPEDLGRFYQRAGLVVLPTLWMENCPVSVLEAFAHGRAVVATRIGGVPELIEDGRTGELYERGDVNGLAGVLGELLADEDRIGAMGSAAAQRWADRYTPEIHCRNLVAIYRRTIEEAR